MSRRGAARRWLLGAAAGVGLVASAACSDGDGRSVARLEVAGRTEVAEGEGEEWQAVRGNRALRAGERVRVVTGTSLVRLGEDRGLALRPGSQIEIDPGGAVGGTRPAAALQAGDVLMLARGPLAVTARDRAGGAVVRDGAARVSGGPELRVAAYGGAAQLVAGGRSLDVPALRQASTRPPGELPPAPEPLAYSPADPWDQRFLGDAIELGSQLAARSEGLTGQLRPGEGQSAGFYRQLLPALEREPAFDQALLTPPRPPGETLVGAAIAGEGTRGGFVERWNSVFAFRSQGAAWGLVALDQGVTRVPLLSAVDAAIGRALEVRGRAAPPPPLPPPGAPAGGSGPSPTAPPTGPVTPAPLPPVPPPPGPPPAPPTSGGVRTGLPLVDDPVNGLIDALGNLLGGLGRPPS